jgi:hypothetical protein
VRPQKKKANAKTLSQVRSIGQRLSDQYKLMGDALKQRDLQGLSSAIKGSQDAMKKLRFVLRIDQ